MPPVDWFGPQFSWPPIRAPTPSREARSLCPSQRSPRLGPTTPCYGFIFPILPGNKLFVVRITPVVHYSCGVGHPKQMYYVTINSEEALRQADGAAVIEE